LDVYVKVRNTGVMHPQSLITEHPLYFKHGATFVTPPSLKQQLVNYFPHFLHFYINATVAESIVKSSVHSRRASTLS